MIGASLLADMPVGFDDTLSLLVGLVKFPEIKN